MTDAFDPNDPVHPLFGFTRGRAAMASRLHTTLRTLRDGTDDPDLRSLLDDILAGRTSPRQLLAHEGFGEQLRDAGEALHRRYENLSPDRRAEEAKASEDAVQRIFGPELDALRRRVEELRAAHEQPAGPHPA